MRDLKHDQDLENLISERVALEIRMNMLENSSPGSADFEVAKSDALAAAREGLSVIVAKIALHRKTH